MPRLAYFFSSLLFICQHCNVGTQSTFIAPIHDFGSEVESYRTAHPEKALLVAILSKKHTTNNTKRLFKSLLVALEVLGPRVLLAGYVNPLNTTHHSIESNHSIPISDEDMLLLFDNPWHLLDYL
jgi:formylmethanofuran dehydrogenase subunit A